MEKRALSLAIAEKKPQRPGGCVGIFFRLLDWNQRFAKKNMFSKKLLPPVRFKQAWKKFGGDEKQPKLRLIAEENNGGFPNAKNSNVVDDEQKHEMHVPGLVARLMGLESMPTSQRDKSKKKVPESGIVCPKPEKFLDKREGLKGGIKQEVRRPQKLQKTSIQEKQPSTRFEVEKLPLKNVLSKSRKHHPKLPSPVKSPRNLSREKPSKLIGAATRILEPGLQTNRSKCALTYSNATRHPPEDANVSRNLEDSYGFGSVVEEGESSCRNCGYMLDKLNGERTISSQPLDFASPFSNHVTSSCQLSCKTVNTPCYHQLKEDFHDDRNNGSARSHVKFTSYTSPFCTGQIRPHLGSQQSKPPKVKSVHLPLGANPKSYMQNQILQLRETVPPRLKATNLMNSKSATGMSRIKNSVPMSQSLSYSSRSRVPSRVENGRFELEKRRNNSMNDSVPHGRKRRPTYISRQLEDSGCLSTTIKKPIIGSPHLVSVDQLGHNDHYLHHECDSLRLLPQQGKIFDSGPGSSNVVSFTFSSPMKQNIGIHEDSETHVRKGLYCNERGEEPALGESDRMTMIRKLPPISGDALGALLEQKLKELGQGEDTSNAPRKTTTTILQELIAALTLDVPLQKDNVPPISDWNNGWSEQSHLSNPKPSAVSQGKSMGVKTPFYQPIDSAHLSPGSVLEPFVSTESCPSSSADDSLGYKTVDDYDPESSIPNLLDSSASLNTKEMSGDIIKNVSEILRCSGLAFGLKENEVKQVEEVLLNAELAFHIAMVSGCAVGRGSPIKHLLLDELDMLASVLWMNFGCSLGIEDGKEANQLKRFVSDSVMEYLGIRFQEYPEKVSRKMGVRMNKSLLIMEIVEVVRTWEKMSRLSIDDLIEREMDYSSREWTVCESEAVENGIEISRYLFQILVDEIVIDLCIWQA